jgi:3-oxoacyl-[acyl-carrier-protein] synthase III
MKRAAIRSVAIRPGAERRTNSWYAERWHDVLEAARGRELSRMFQATEDPSEVERAMAPFLGDPFRGARVRWRLGPDETLLDLEIGAARDALSLAGVAPDEVDLVLCASWLPERFVAPGDAVYVARALETAAPAYNVESACSSGTACLQLAHGVIAAGTHRNVLVVLSSSVDRHCDPRSMLSWISSDTAAALVVQPGRRGEGILASAAENTASTCGALEHDLVVEDGRAVVRMVPGSAGGQGLRDTMRPELMRRVCHRALSAAGVEPREVAYWAVSTPLAWYHALFCEALDVPPERTANLFAEHANLGASFPAFALHRGVSDGRIEPGDRVVVFTVGSTSSLGATVLTAGDVRTRAPQHGGQLAQAR